MNIAITGASGFIGTNLINSFKPIGNINLILIQRKINTLIEIDQFTYEQYFNLNQIPHKIDIFIHLASPNFDNERNNELRDGIIGLSKKILKTLPKYNCRKFIFFSSAKVYGESSSKNIVFSEEDILHPISDYAKSKAKAEENIIEISQNLDINFLIYRLPFVYGAGMRSNLSLITRLIDKSLPMMIFDEDTNLKKSFLSIENIKKALLRNINEPSSVNNEILNISDERPLSLSKFIYLYKKNKRSKSILIKFNKIFLKLFLNIPIVKKMIIKIFGNFQIDNKKIKSILKDDIISTEEGIKYLL